MHRPPLPAWSRSIWAIPAVVLLIFGMSLTWFANDEYDEAVEQEYRFLEAHARAADATLSGLFRNIDYVLKKVAGERATLPLARRDQFENDLAVRLRDFPEIRTLLIADASGRVEMSNHPEAKKFNLSNREYFTIHRDSTSAPKMFVSRPFNSNFGNISITFSRAIPGADRQFHGVVAAGINPAHLESVLRSSKPDNFGSAATLFNTQGDILYRLPDAEKNVGGSLANGKFFKKYLLSNEPVKRFMGVGSIDPVKRLFVFRRVGQTSHIISVSSKLDEVLTEWRRDVVIRLLTFIAAAAVTLTLTWIAQRRQEEILAGKALNDQLIRSALDAVVLIDATGRIRGWNAQSENIFGWTEQQALGRMMHETIIPLHDREAHVNGVKRFLDSGEAAILNTRRETQAMHRNGRVFPIELAVTSVKTTGEIVFSAFIRDISKRKADEIELKHHRDHLQELVSEQTIDLVTAKEAAEAANLAKSSFLSSISHELRTPLNAVLGYAQLLAMDEHASQDTHDNAAEIEKAGRHLLALVNDVLDLARIESGRMDINIEDVELSEVLADCRRLIEPQAQARRIAIDLPPAPVSLRADRVRLRQVLLNLLSNAVKYNRDGGQVAVRGIRLAEGDYRISITDSGFGIPAERIGELFQPFNRIGAERGNIEGTGIGLVITKSLVELMAGRMGAESIVGAGSTFWVELPLAGGVSTPETAREIATKCHAAILVAEDHEPNRRLLRRQIEKLGYPVEFACDGSEALHKWQTGHFDLILTDCNMPVMDGYELTRAIRAQESADSGRSHIPILALTANALKDAITISAEAGMDDFLAKPLQLDALRQALKKWLRVADKGAVTELEPAIAPVDERPVYADYLETLAAMLGDDDPDEAGRMLHSFLNSAGECLAEVKTGIARQDAVMFVRAVHKLKSSARMIGATALADLCQRLEETGKRQAWAAIMVDLPEFETALSETKERIQTLPAREPHKPAETRVNDLAGLRIMLVDDDPFILDYLTRLLVSRGAQSIRHASEGHSALRELEAHPSAIDVVVCDLNMPGMDGVEFLRHLAESSFAGAVIVVSGSADLLTTVYELAQAHGLRILGTLAKPFTPEKFFGMLRQDRPSGKVISTDTISSRQEIRPLDVAEALARGEFVPFFQPKVDALTLRPVGVEALARWLRPNGTTVAPSDFIPVVEAHGFIDSLFKTILGSTLESANRLMENGHDHLKFAVNMAASSLGTLDLPEHIASATFQHGIGADRLILEITESGIMQDARIGLDVLSRLRIKGVGLSIDDFGTGYSTISQLRRLPFTELKIDRSFVASAAQDHSARIILESSVGMAKRLNLATVAEGVETEADMEMIRSLGCDVVQGFLVARPMPLEELVVWLDERRGQV